MNIVTYNVRGIGRGVKWAAIRRLIKKGNVDLICIQEIKKERISEVFLDFVRVNKQFEMPRLF